MDVVELKKELNVWLELSADKEKRYIFCKPYLSTLHKHTLINLK